jgi:hypothetical protein
MGGLVPNAPLKAFSDPFDPMGYRDAVISDDTVTAVYLAFIEKTRKAESEYYLRTLKGASFRSSTCW